MNSNTVDLHIPGGESMRLVARLATVGYIASAGLTLDEAEDMKIAVAEALGAVGGERLHVQFSRRTARWKSRSWAMARAGRAKRWKAKSRAMCSVRWPTRWKSRKTGLDRSVPFA